MSELPRAKSFVPAATKAKERRRKSIKLTTPLERDGETKDDLVSQLEQLQKQVAAHIKALKAPHVPEI